MKAYILPLGLMALALAGLTLALVQHERLETQPSVTTPEVTTPTSPTETQTLSYRDLAHGYRLEFPTSWEGYTVVTTTWEGRDLATGGQTVSATGPQIEFRHPAYSQNGATVPIMVITLADWEKVVSEDLSVGAAPIPPTEIARNATHVFATPARYTFGFASDTQITEAQSIVDSFTLTAD